MSSKRDEIAAILEREFGFMADPIGTADRILAVVAEPSEAMVEAIAAVLVRGGEKRSNAPVSAPVIWQAGIDAAMEEPNG